MVLSNRNFVILMFLCIVFVLSIPGLYANYAKVDDVLEKWAQKARAAALPAYNPHPEEVAHSFNKKVEDSLKGEKINTRSNLKEGDCVATNPIDSCWRCDPKWATNRKKLADCGN